MASVASIINEIAYIYYKTVTSIFINKIQQYIVKNNNVRQFKQQIKYI